MSTIAWACAWLSENRPISSCFALSVSDAPRMIFAEDLLRRPYACYPLFLQATAGPQIVTLKVNPRFVDLRDDPRLGALLDRAGLT